MKIIFFTRLFYPHVGGVEKHVYEVGKRLVQEGHEVTIITESLPKSRIINPEYDLKLFKIYHIKIGKNLRFKKFTIWKWLWNHRELLKNADIIHAHDVFYWFLPFRFLYPNKKIYTTFHGYETKFPISKKAIIIRKMSEILSYGNICVGEYIKKWYGTRPDIITFGAVDIKDKKQIKRKAINKITILFIGRLEEDTGGYIYNEVLNILENNKVEFKFIALGDGKLRKPLERFGDVKGFLSDVYPYIERADIIFASSYLSILEALSLKKFVISVYTNPLKKDYLSMTPFSTGIIIENDPVQISHAIINFKNNVALHSKKNDITFDWVEKQTWDKLKNQYLSLWKI